MSVVERPLRVVLFGDGESPHLLKWARSDPWWDAERGEAMIEERATL